MRRWSSRPAAWTKTYSERGWFGPAREVRAAVDVNLQLRRGQTLGIVGESGSGKSTVARCIVRLIDPSAGEGAHRRRRYRDAWRARAAAAAAQGADRVPGSLPLSQPAPHGRRGDHRRPAQLRHAARRKHWSARAGCSTWCAWSIVADRYPHQFSGGQRQRICIARALAMEPELLIADEAVSALDVSVQAQVLQLLEEIRTRLDLAMLFITHDLRVAAQVCDQVAVMSKGRVVEIGPAEEIFLRPRARIHTGSVRRRARPRLCLRFDSRQHVESDAWIAWRLRKSAFPGSKCASSRAAAPPTRCCATSARRDRCCSRPSCRPPAAAGMGGAGAPRAAPARPSRSGGTWPASNAGSPGSRSRWDSPRRARCAASARGGVTLKWPNDLMVNRRKLGGILIETRPLPRSDAGTASPGSVVIVGIGINCRAQPRLGARLGRGVAALDACCGTAFHATWSSARSRAKCSARSAPGSAQHDPGDRRRQLAREMGLV
jgi:ABC-type dipeptide/oligopeptide/nickel transport system ATPase subunit